MATGNWVDFKEIRNSITIEEVLDFLGVDTLTRTGDALVGPCPVHGGNNPRAFRVDPDRNVWFCFTQCRRGGNQLDLVAAVRDIPIRDAALLLKRHLEARPPPGAPTPADAQPSPSRAPPRTVPTAPAPTAADNAVIDVKLALRGDHPHLAVRGLTPETVAHFGLGYCSRGLMRGTIAVPIHNARGGLVAYAGRRLKPQEAREYGKYKLPRGFHKELELFNWHRARVPAHQRGHMIVVEGFFTAMLLHQAGHPNTVAAMGSGLSEAQLSRLSRVPQVVLLFDGDDAGRSGAARAFTALATHTDVRLGELPDGVEPEALPEPALRWLLHGLTSLELTHISLRSPTDVAAGDD